MLAIIARFRTLVASDQWCSFRADRGATAVEYSLMASLIAVVIIGAVALFGEQVRVPFEAFVDGL